jgi:N-formylglutamate amidohydrolase
MNYALGPGFARAIWSRGKAVAARPGLRNNSDGGREMNDKDRPMPPLVAFAGALGAMAVVRWAYRTALRVNRELEEARLARVAEAARSGEIPTLRRDPVTGAYRPS